MKVDWRTSLVSEAIQAFSRDLNYAVAVVTPRKSAAQPQRVVWGCPPRFVAGRGPLGRTDLTSAQ
jgi:hypothetical protein